MLILQVGSCATKMQIASLISRIFEHFYGEIRQIHSFQPGKLG
jgi:hypothetical protein